MIKDPVKLDKAYEQAKATLEIEGYSLTNEDEKNIKDVASGKMSRSELIVQLKK